MALRPPALASRVTLCPQSRPQRFGNKSYLMLFIFLLNGIKVQPKGGLRISSGYAFVTLRGPGYSTWGHTSDISPAPILLPLHRLLSHFRTAHDRTLHTSQDNYHPEVDSPGAGTDDGRPCDAGGLRRGLRFGRRIHGPRSAVGFHRGLRNQRLQIPMEHQHGRLPLRAVRRPRRPHGPAAGDDSRQCQRPHRYGLFPQYKVSAAA